MLEATEAEVQAVVDRLKGLSLVVESSGGRVMRYAHNVGRVLGVPAQAVALLTVIMLRGPQTVGELRIHSERLHRFADISSVEAFPRGTRASARPGRSWWSCRGNRARAKRAGRTCCPGAPALPAAEAATPGAAGGDGQQVTLGELAALKTNVARLEDELAEVRATVARIMQELGLPPA